MRTLTHLTYKGAVPPKHIRKINNVRQKTVIIDIDESGFLELLKGDLYHLDSFKVSMGVAFVHPDDEYNKRKGTLVALANMKDAMFTVDKVGKTGSIVNVVARAQLGCKLPQIIVVSIVYYTDINKMRATIYSNDIF